MGRDDDLNRKREYVRVILYGWDGYDSNLTPEENLIELIIEMGMLDEAKSVLSQYARRRW